MGRRRDQDSPAKALIEARRQRAIELRKSGATYANIGKILGISHEQARKDVQYCLKQLVKRRDATTEEYLVMELERLDALQKAVWPGAVKGNLQKIQTVLMLMKHRSRLLGIDQLKMPEQFKPVVFSITGVIDDSDE